jgi:hypothetical protein
MSTLTTTGSSIGAYTFNTAGCVGGDSVWKMKCTYNWAEGDAYVETDPINIKNLDCDTQLSASGAVTDPTLIYDLTT